MAIRDGFRPATDVIASFNSPYLSPHLATDASNVWPPSHAPESAFLSVGGSSTHTFRPQHRGARALDGHRVHSYVDDMYNRIYIAPSSINVGNVLGRQERTVSLWNAFLYERKDLTQAEVIGDAGAYAILPAGVTLPYELQALEEVLFTVAVELAGPPNIVADFVLNVEGVEYLVPITGRRVVLFPFEPSWNLSPVDETITISSWVIGAVDGSEQSGSTWGDHATRSFEYQTILKDIDEVQLAENLLFTWQGRFFALPIWTEKRALNSAAFDETLVFDAAGFSAEPGSLLVLWDGPDHTEIKEVATVNAGGVELTTPVDETWPEGTVVYPLAVALLGAQMTGSRETTGVVRMPVMFDCEPSATPDNIPTVAPPLTYRGDELYLGPVNWRGPLPMAYTSDRKKLDFGTLKFSSFTASGFSKYSRRHDWMLDGDEDMAAFREFFGRRQGVARPVWMPSGINDFTLVEDATSTNSFITVKPNSYDTLIAQHPARRDIIIEMWDGSYITRRILSSSTGSLGTLLSLDAPNGVNFTAADVKRISYLTWYRLDSPAVTIRHFTDKVATVEAGVVMRKPKETVA